jgi:ceramide glucosyltransferase
MVFSRPALEAIGGFHPVLDYLADDYQLGSRIARSGLEVRLSEVVVQDFLPAYDFRKFLEHQIRWARTIRDSRRWGYVGLAVTYGIPWAVIALAFSAGAPWAWVLLAVTVALRMAASWFVSAKILNDSQSVRDLWLLPLRDAVALGIWIASFAGHRIEWRGQQYVLKDGKLRPA